jgi:hypothetical protein
VERYLLLATNKTLLKVTLLAPLRDLRNSLWPKLAAQTLDQFSSFHGYYLMDTPVEEGIQEPIWEREIAKISGRIFRQELSELGIPPEHWPAVDDYQEFKKHIAVERLALIADLGEKELKTTEVAET